ncbi:hypothetical protein CRYUN_Cryun14cG0013900 [Craigia yunnanensis]
MAQPGEIPVNPPIPPAAQIQLQPPPPPPPVRLQLQPQPHLFSTAKRRREEEDPSAVGETGELAPKRQAKAQDVIFRIVVPSRQIGKVIGKGGHRIQKIREDTKAAIKIADAIVRHEERVIIISSKDNENMISDAENALQQIATLILKEDDSSAEAAKVDAVSAGHVAANTIRLLIAGSQAGCLIGMSGQNIEKLRSSSGASITILAPNQLPLCASAHESDRVVQISGDVPAVLKALAEIGYELRENPPRQVISISPAYNYNLLRPAQPQPYVDPTSGYSIFFILKLFLAFNCYILWLSSFNIFSYNHIIFRTTTLAADYVTFEMVVSETFIGGLIGRCGSNISRIRIESGATIKVYGGKGEQNVRHIQFSGSSQQVIFFS